MDILLVKPLKKLQESQQIKSYSVYSLQLRQIIQRVPRLQIGILFGKDLLTKVGLWCNLNKNGFKN